MKKLLNIPSIRDIMTFLYPLYKDTRMIAHQRPTVIAGNWKMHKTLQESENFIKELAPSVSHSTATLILFVPFTAIRTASEATAGTNILIGAQNMNDASEGAFTGEIAADMLVEAGAKFVLLGHSERRHIFGESDAFINKKIKRALSTSLIPILCIGETLEQKEAGNTQNILKEQLTQSLEGIAPEQIASLFIAYEPVWAIGSGKTATCEQAQEVHAFCRQTIAALWGEESAQTIAILYGGSVKPDNANNLMKEPDIDGLLVGGAALSADSFAHIVNYQTNLTHHQELGVS